MKRFKLLLMSLAVSSAFSLNSCKDDDNPAAKPSISFKTGAGYTYQNGTKATGAPIKIGIIATGEENLTRVTLSIVGGGTLLDSPMNSKTFSYDYDHVLSNTTGQETYVAQATMKNGETAEVSFTLTKVQSEEIVLRVVTLSGQNNADPLNFYSAESNITYNLADAKNVAASIDWAYFFGATNKATISSPDNAADINVIWSSSPDRPATWSTRNATRFRLTNMTTTAFDAIATGTGSNNADILAEYAAAPVTGVKANNLAVGQVWIFETRTPTSTASIRGLFKVTAVPTDNTGNVDVEVKMETNP